MLLVNDEATNNDLREILPDIFIDQVQVRSLWVFSIFLLGMCRITWAVGGNRSSLSYLTLTVTHICETIFFYSIALSSSKLNPHNLGLLDFLCAAFELIEQKVYLGKTAKLLLSVVPSLAVLFAYTGLMGSMTKAKHQKKE